MIISMNICVDRMHIKKDIKAIKYFVFRTEFYPIERKILKPLIVAKYRFPYNMYSSNNLKNEINSTSSKMTLTKPNFAIFNFEVTKNNKFLRYDYSTVNNWFSNTIRSGTLFEIRLIFSHYN